MILKELVCFRHLFYLIELISTTYPKLKYFPIYKFWKVYVDTNPIFSTTKLYKKVD